MRAVKTIQKDRKEETASYSGWLTLKRNVNDISIINSIVLYAASLVTWFIIASVA